ncbi:MAG: SUMF1/EgtB/PvdO family nonheme iron enzyme [Hyphomonadaceae bacterium]|nr:SUMF1/EgtB/PvdO family nonheme iron enzyme [Hyphomonadaceae bacterium]
MAALAMCGAALIFSPSTVFAQGNVSFEIQRAETLIAQGDYVEALATVRSAISKAPSDYRVRYYSGMALLGLQRFEEARTETELALSLAPEADKAGVQRLLDTIALQSVSLTAEADAEAALAAGLNGRAARLFAQAFEADKSKAKAGFKAVDLYVGVLAQPEEAVKILRLIEGRATDPVERLQAAEKLKPLKSTIEKMVLSYLEAASNSVREKDVAKVKSTLEEAVLIAPNSTTLSMALVSYYSGIRDEGGLKFALNRLPAKGIDLHHGLYAVKPKPYWLEKPWFAQMVAGYRDKSYSDYYNSIAATPILTPFRDCEEVCPELTLLPSTFFVFDENSEGREPVLTLQPIAIGRFEITYDQFNACTRDGACPKIDPRDFDRGKHAASFVSWNDANAYLAWLSKKTGKTYRLPLREEWVYAAQAGTPKTYITSNVINKSVAAVDGFKPWPQQVGSYPANEFGLHDMLGNVMEWTANCVSSRLVYQENSINTHRKVNSESCSQRVLLGGHYASPISDITGYRFWEKYVGEQTYDTGFRVVREF